MLTVPAALCAAYAPVAAAGHPDPRAEHDIAMALLTASRESNPELWSKADELTFEAERDAAEALVAAAVRNSRDHEDDSSDSYMDENSQLESVAELHATGGYPATTGWTAATLRLIQSKLGTPSVIAAAETAVREAWQVYETVLAQELPERESLMPAKHDHAMRKFEENAAMPMTDDEASTARALRDRGQAVLATVRPAFPTAPNSMLRGDRKNHYATHAKQVSFFNVVEELHYLDAGFDDKTPPLWVDSSTERSLFSDPSDREHRSVRRRVADGDDEDWSPRKAQENSEWAMYDSAVSRGLGDKEFVPGKGRRGFSPPSAFQVIRATVADDVAAGRIDPVAADNIVAETMERQTAREIHRMALKDLFGTVQAGGRNELSLRVDQPLLGPALQTDRAFAAAGDDPPVAAAGDDQSEGVNDDAVIPDRDPAVAKAEHDEAIALLHASRELNPELWSVADNLTFETERAAAEELVGAVVRNSDDESSDFYSEGCSDIVSQLERVAELHTTGGYPAITGRTAATLRLIQSKLGSPSAIAAATAAVREAWQVYETDLANDEDKVSPERESLMPDKHDNAMQQFEENAAMPITDNEASTAGARRDRGEAVLASVRPAFPTAPDSMLRGYGTNHSATHAKQVTFFNVVEELHYLDEGFDDKTPRTYTGSRLFAGRPDSEYRSVGQMVPDDDDEDWSPLKAQENSEWAMHDSAVSRRLGDVEFVPRKGLRGSSHPSALQIIRAAIDDDIAAGRIYTVAGEEIVPDAMHRQTAREFHRTALLDKFGTVQAGGRKKLSLRMDQRFRGHALQMQRGFESVNTFVRSFRVRSEAHLAAEELKALMHDVSGSEAVVRGLTEQLAGLEMARDALDEFFTTWQVEDTNREIIVLQANSCNKKTIADATQRELLQVEFERVYVRQLERMMSLFLWFFEEEKSARLSPSSSGRDAAETRAAEIQDKRQ